MGSIEPQTPFVATSVPGSWRRPRTAIRGFYKASWILGLALALLGSLLACSPNKKKQFPSPAHESSPPPEKPLDGDSSAAQKKGTNFSAAEFDRLPQVIELRQEGFDITTEEFTLSSLHREQVLDYLDRIQSNKSALHASKRLKISLSLQFAIDFGDQSISLSIHAIPSQVGIFFDFVSLLSLTRYPGLSWPSEPEPESFLIAQNIVDFERIFQSLMSSDKLPSTVVSYPSSSDYDIKISQFWNDDVASWQWFELDRSAFLLPPQTFQTMSVLLAKNYLCLRELPFESSEIYGRLDFLVARTDPNLLISSLEASLKLCQSMTNLSLPPRQVQMSSSRVNLRISFSSEDNRYPWLSYNRYEQLDLDLSCDTKTEDLEASMALLKILPNFQKQYPWEISFHRNLSPQQALQSLELVMKNSEALRRALTKWRIPPRKLVFEPPPIQGIGTSSWIEFETGSYKLWISPSATQKDYDSL